MDEETASPHPSAPRPKTAFERFLTCRSQGLDSSRSIDQGGRSIPGQARPKHDQHDPKQGSVQTVPCLLSQTQINSRGQNTASQALPPSTIWGSSGKISSSTIRESSGKTSNNLRPASARTPVKEKQHPPPHGCMGSGPHNLAVSATQPPSFQASPATQIPTFQASPAAQHPTFKTSPASKPPSQAVPLQQFDQQVHHSQSKESSPHQTNRATPAPAVKEDLNIGGPAVAPIGGPPGAPTGAPIGGPTGGPTPGMEAIQAMHEAPGSKQVVSASLASASDPVAGTSQGPASNPLPVASRAPAYRVLHGKLQASLNIQTLLPKSPEPFVQDPCSSSKQEHATDQADDNSHQKISQHRSCRSGSRCQSRSGCQPGSQRGSYPQLSGPAAKSSDRTLESNTVQHLVEAPIHPQHVMNNSPAHHPVKVSASLPCAVSTTPTHHQLNLSKCTPYDTSTTPAHGSVDLGVLAEAAASLANAAKMLTGSITASPEQSYKQLAEAAKDLAASASSATTHNGASLSSNAPLRRWSQHMPVCEDCAVFWGGQSFAYSRTGSRGSRPSTSNPITHTLEEPSSTYQPTRTHQQGSTNQLGEQNHQGGRYPDSGSHGKCSSWSSWGSRSSLCSRNGYPPSEYENGRGLSYSGYGYTPLAYDSGSWSSLCSSYGNPPPVYNDGRGSFYSGYGYPLLADDDGRGSSYSGYGNPPSADDDGRGTSYSDNNYPPLDYDDGGCQGIDNQHMYNGGGSAGSVSKWVSSHSRRNSEVEDSRCAGDIGSGESQVLSLKEGGVNRCPADVAADQSHNGELPINQFCDILRDLDLAPDHEVLNMMKAAAGAQSKDPSQASPKGSHANASGASAAMGSSQDVSPSWQLAGP
eukprot:gene21442-28409_t